jgi:DNA-directed RNA polymerase specialized sigma24 family protein
MHNTITNYNRAVEQREKVNVDDIQLEAAVPEEDDYRMERARLRAEIAKLPPRQREVVSRRIIEGKSIVEIAKELKADYNTTKANFRHGILAVKCRIRHEQ